MQRVIYSLDIDVSDKDIASLLGKSFKPSAMVCEEWSLLDTHDWAFWQAGMVLEQLAANKKLRCAISQLSSGTPEGGLPSAMPAFVWQLPPSPLRERLAPLWGMRALMPQLQLKRQTTCWSLSNSDGKRVVEADLCRFFSLEGTMVGCWLQLQPCRGYDSALPPIIEKLQKKQQWIADDHTVIEQLLAQNAITPAQRIKPLSFNKKSAAALALKKAMQQQLTIMQSQQQGIMDATDSEFLHAYRIAIRRMRSLLAIAHPLMPKGLQQQLTDYFKTLGDLTSPARDADVHLLNFATGLGAIPAQKLEQLQPFYQQLQQQQHDSYRALCHQFTSAHYTTTFKLLAEWNPSKEGGKNRMAAHHFVQRSIEQQLDSLLQHGKKIDKKSPDQALHTLRKQCKQLRYTIECFASLLPEKRAVAALQLIKTLQNYLGSFQDLCVQQACLQQFADGLGGSKAHQSCQQTIATITKNMMEQRKRLRKQYSAVFRDFRKNSALKKLLDQEGKR